jgi:hypothetical protein
MKYITFKNVHFYAEPWNSFLSHIIEVHPNFQSLSEADQFHIIMTGLNVDFVETNVCFVYMQQCKMLRGVCVYAMCKAQCICVNATTLMYYGGNKLLLYMYTTCFQLDTTKIQFANLTMNT